VGIAGPLRLAGLLLSIEGLVAALHAQPFTLHYDVRFGPLRILSLQTTVDLGPERYRTQTRLRTEGLVGVLFPWTAESTTEGTRSPLRPSWHTSEGRYRSQRRTVELRYAGDGSVEARVEPPLDDDPHALVSTAARRATVDPLTASLAAMEQACAGRIPVFDGRRRYDLRLEDRGSSEVPRTRGALYTGPAQRCRALIEPRAGAWDADARGQETPATLEFWIASPRAHLLPLPVYLELSGRRGTLHIQLTAIE